MLPLAVENYLSESGFSATEIIVLRKLLEENLLTLRELSAKTGKGNGVIDAALKKLIRYGIVGIERINEHPKYKIIGPQTIIDWAKKNLRENRELMERKHQTFAQFMSNLAIAKSHPEMEHFSGKEGIMKAYDKLLETRQELLTYFDPAAIPADDALADFLLQYSRRRQVHGVYQRIIAPDSVAARRFRTRDPFEYRKTVLIRKEDYGMVLTKIISGDIVACIDTNNTEGSFIHFAQLAESERCAFERLWTDQIERDQSKVALQISQKINDSSIVPRERFRMNSLQKISVYSLVGLLLFWIALSFSGSTEGFYNYLYSFLFGLIPLVSGIIAIRNQKRWGGLSTPIGKAVFFIGLGIFLWGCGETVWAYYNFFLNIPAPYPSFSDLAYIPGTFLYSFGTIFLSDAMGAKLGLQNIYAKIFTVLAPIFILLFSYYTLIYIARDGVLISSHENTLKMLFDVMYPLSDFLGLTIAVLLSGLSFKHMGGRYTFDISAILAGLICMFVANFIFSYTTTAGLFYNGNFGDLIFTLGVFLLSFGVLGFCRDKRLLEA